MYSFWRKKNFYENKHNRKASRAMVISPMIDDYARSAAKDLGIEVTDMPIASSFRCVKEEKMRGKINQSRKPGVGCADLTMGQDDTAWLPVAWAKDFSPLRRPQ